MYVVLGMTSRIKGSNYATRLALLSVILMIIYKFIKIVLKMLYIYIYIYIYINFNYYKFYVNIKYE